MRSIAPLNAYRNHSRSPILPMIVVLISILCVLPSLLSAQGDRWGVVETPNSPPVLFGHTLVLIDGHIFLFGGQAGATQSVLFNTLWIFDPDENDWILETPANEPPPARQGHCAVAHDGKLIILHGRGELNPNLNDVWVYDPADKTWRNVELDNGPPGRVDASAVVIAGRILLFGGRTGDGSQVFGDVWSFDPQTEQWEQKNRISQGYERFGHSVMPLDDEMMYVFGGHGQAPLNDMWVYHAGSDSWSIFLAQGESPSARTLHASTHAAGLMWIFGGTTSWSAQTGKSRQPSFSDESLSDTWVFDASTNGWARRTDMSQGLIQAASSITRTPNRIILFGGRDPDSTAVNQTAEYENEDTAVRTDAQRPLGFALSQNVPNPFNPQTTIAFCVKQTCHVRLRVFDTLGREVAVLADAIHSPGEYRQTFQARGLSSGVYLYRIEMGGVQAVKKMILLE